MQFSVWETVDQNLEQRKSTLQTMPTPTKKSCSRYFGSGGYYTAPSGMKDGNTILAGSQYYTPDEWEVFYRG